MLAQDEYVKNASVLQEYAIFVIVAAGELVGVCELLEIDWINSSCKIHMYFENRANNTPKYGSKALNALLNHLFNDLGLWKVWTEVRLDDVVMTTLYKSYGFTQEVRKRNHAFVGGSYKTVVELGILEVEFNPV